MNPRRLYRSADDRILAGVAGGVAAYFDVDPVIVRIIWFLSIFFTGSLTFWAYIVMIFVVPLEPSEWPAQSPWAPGGGPAGYAAAYTPPTTTGPADAGATAPADAAAGAQTGGPAAPSDPTAGSGHAPGTPPTGAPAAGWGWGYDWRTQRRQERWQRRAERWQQRAERHEYRSYGGPSLVFGLLLILVGGMLAWHQVDPNFDLNITWPVVVIAFGALLVVSSLRFRDK